MSSIGQMPAVYSGLFKSPGTMAKNDFQNSVNTVAYRVIKSDPERKKSKMPIVLTTIAIVGAVMALPAIKKASKITLPEDIKGFKFSKDGFKFVFVKAADAIESLQNRAVTAFNKLMGRNTGAN